MDIPLTRGKVAVIDDGDADLVAGYRWYALFNKGIWYAVAPDGSGGLIGMHRVILGLGKGEKGDHRDGDGLNNRRSNLRKATYGQNNANRAPNRNTATGFKGIYRSEEGRWIARLRTDGRTYQRRPFDTPEEAAKAYDDLAREHFGEFARLNFGS